MKEFARWTLEGLDFVAGVADTPEEQEACFRLRYEAYCIRKPTLPKENYPDGLETDEFDHHSTHMLALHDGNAIGTMRLIDCSHGCLLDGMRFSDTTFAFPDKDPITGHAMYRHTTEEVTRWVAQPYPLPSGARAHVSMLIVQAAVRSAKERGKTHWVYEIREPNWLHLVYDGWPAIPIIPGVHNARNARLVVCVMPLPWGDEYFTRQLLP